MDDVAEGQRLGAKPGDRGTHQRSLSSTGQQDTDKATRTEQDRQLERGEENAA